MFSRSKIIKISSKASIGRIVNSGYFQVLSTRESKMFKVYSQEWILILIMWALDYRLFSYRWIFGFRWTSGKDCFISGESIGFKWTLGEDSFLSGEAFGFRWTSGEGFFLSGECLVLSSHIPLPFPVNAKQVLWQFTALVWGRKCHS